VYGDGEVAFCRNSKLRRHGGQRLPIYQKFAARPQSRKVRAKRPLRNGGVVELRKGEILNHEPAEWSFLDGYEDIRECRTDGAKKTKDHFWVYEAIGFTANVTSERDVLFANKKEQTSLRMGYLCFPANFDPRK